MTEGTERRLAAIVAIDVAGYSRLMGADERGTLRRLKEHRAAAEPISMTHGGRLVGTAGDGLLLEFPSVVAAVESTIEIQTLMAERNADLADDEKCSTASASTLATSWSRATTSTRPVQVWRWAAGSDALRDAGGDSPATPAAKPSIAVLPFDYLGAGKAENGHLADGLSEIIIASLAQIPFLDVIARNSSFTFKDTAVDVRAVSKKLGVRYVLEGSVQLSGDRIRVTAQLVDGADGKHVWADTYDETVSDIFAVQDAVTLAINREIYGKTLAGSQTHQMSTNSLQAWSEVIKGNAEFSLFTQEGNTNARHHFERAIDIDPNYAGAYSRVAMTHFIDARLGFGNNPEQSTKQAETIALQALALNDRLPNALTALAFIRVIQKRPEDAKNLVHQALEIAPNDQNTNAIAAWVYKYVGEAKRSLPYFDKARRLQPIDQRWLVGDHFGALLDAGESEAAINLLPDILASHPEDAYADMYTGIAIANFRLGDRANAQAVIAKALDLNPGLSIARLRQWNLAYVDDAIPEARNSVLRELGLPDE